MKRLLMVAEKPSIAESIAKALAPNSNYNKRSGTSVPVFEYEGMFLNRRFNFRVTSTVGHIFTTDFHPKYNSWDKVEPGELFTAPIIQKEANPKSRMVDHLRNEAKGCAGLVLWLDCDREGENIAFEVITVVKDILGQEGYLFEKEGRGSADVPANVWRIIFSSLVPNDLRQAFERPVLPDVRQSQAVEARQEIDLRVGVAFSRFQTRYLQNKFSIPESPMISYGPCQMPTLWFCVMQRDIRDKFTPTDLYSLDLKTTSNLTAHWNGGNLIDRDVVIAWQTIIEKAKEVTVTKTQKSLKKIQRPKALNTVNLLKKASTRLGLGPMQALHTAEKLYLSGFITYPRTETTAYPKNLDLKQLLQQFQNCPQYAKIINQLLEGDQFSAPKSGTDAGDHPPITPCSPKGFNQLNGVELQMYNLVVENFLQTVSPNATVETQTLELSAHIPIDNDSSVVSDQVFKCAQSYVTSPGWLAVSNHSRFDFEDVMMTDEGGDTPINKNDIQLMEDEPRNTFDLYHQGDVLSIQSIQLTTSQTQRPPLLSESRLLSLMEQHGIGTDASMPTHIQNIIDRRYVTLITAGRLLDPSSLGICLCRGFLQIDPELVRPEVRANIEQQCTLIATGKLEKEFAVTNALKQFAAKFYYFLSRIGELDSLFEVHFSPVNEAGQPTTRCGYCKRYLYFTAKPRPSLHCRNCNMTFSLPPNAQLRAPTEDTCPFDGFETLMMLERKTDGSARAVSICPLCYNDPPTSKGDAMRCSECCHPTCPKSIEMTKIARCPNRHCKSGIIFAQYFHGVNPSIQCNECTFFVPFDPTSVKSVTKSAKRCGECDAFKVKLTLIGAEPNVITGCVTCSESITERLAPDAEQTKIFLKRGGHRGRGRGRGGRRGRRAPIDWRLE